MATGVCAVGWCCQCRLPLTPGLPSQIVLFVFCLFLLAIQLWFRPFLSKLDDAAATVAMVALLLVSGVQLYVHACSPSTLPRAPPPPCQLTRAMLYVRGSYVATVAASQTLTVRGACVGEQICLHAHCCCHVQDEHLASGRDVFILFLNVVLLATPAIYLAWVHGGKFYRSINKRLERGWLCFKPRLSKAHMATLREAEQRMANHHLDDDVAVDVAGIEMKTTASEDDAKRRKKKKKKKQAEIRRNNPVAFTDMTPDTL